MMRRPTLGFMAALLLAAPLGWGVAAESTPPDQATLLPSTGLASAVPAVLGGIPVTRIGELSGPEVLAPDPGSPVQMASLAAVLEILGKAPQDLEVAYASYEAPASEASVVLVALRVEGVSAALLNLADAQAAAAARGSEHPFLTAVSLLVDNAQLVGPRLVWVQPGSDDRAWAITYPADDVLYWVSGRAARMSQVLAALPDGGPSDAESQGPDE